MVDMRPKTAAAGSKEMLARIEASLVHDFPMVLPLKIHQAAESLLNAQISLERHKIPEAEYRRVKQASIMELELISIFAERAYFTFARKKVFGDSKFGKLEFGKLRE